MIQNAQCSELQGSENLFRVWCGIHLVFYPHYCQIAQVSLNSLLCLGCCGVKCALET